MSNIMMRTAFSTILLALLPMVVSAQDDMYFVPTKKNVDKSASNYGIPRNTYYSGIDCDVDEYNRRGGSYVEVLDSAGNDIITFSPEMGVYPDSMSRDYECTRQMSRFDDYAWSDGYNEGWRDGVSASWSVYDPWYYDSWYYGSWYGWRHPWRYGWYSGWYDPWYHSWYGGWYRPYYYYGWHGGWYGGGISHRTYRGYTGSSNHGRVDRFGSSSGSKRNNNFSGYRGTQRQNTSTSSFGGNRNRSTYNVPQRSQSTSVSSGSFGGSRGSFGGGGGTRSGGGSSGGGGSFGGRR